MNSVEILANAAESDKLNHAYLAPVYPGTNLRHYGAELAQEILCGPSQKNCRDKVIRETHPDLSWLTVLDNKSKISIGQVEKVILSSTHAPIESERKVYMVDRVEDFSTEAANSILKILEEPPEFVYFILLTEDPNRLLPTILSRCQDLPAGGLTAEGLSQFLETRGFSAEERDYLISAVNYRADLVDRVLEEEISDPLSLKKEYEEKFAGRDLIELAKDFSNSTDVVEKDVAGKLFHEALPDAGKSEIIQSVKAVKGLPEPELEYLLTKGLLYWRRSARNMVSGSGTEGAEYRLTVRRAKAFDSALRRLETNANLQLLLEATFLKMTNSDSSL